MRRALLIASMLVFSAGALAEAPWKLLERERGITVETREEPGRDLPTLRGRGVIAGEVTRVLAVILDEKLATEWAEGADECRLLKNEDERTALIYTLTDTPWPVSDRDMVMRRKVEVIKPGEEFRVFMTCAPKAKPERDGVIRIVTCETYFHIKKQSDTTTFMEYQVNVDPGGKLPSWLVRWAAKKIPMNTFVSLEEMVAKVGAKYDDEAEGWASAKE